MSPIARSTPRLPQFVERKIYKTGQTRGADDDEIFQNRVGRNSTVLIPLPMWDRCMSVEYEKGFIVLVSPSWYFNKDHKGEALQELGLALGVNALIFYQSRVDWVDLPPPTSWAVATARTAPLGGKYVARIAGTTAAADGGRINHGYTTTGMKGAGIRVYEYAPSTTITQCRIQLEAILWLCEDAIEALETCGMDHMDAESRKKAVLAEAAAQNLLDMDALHAARMVDNDGVTICPLCLERLTAMGFANRMEQAEGREVPDLTITEVSLFHIQELRYGVLNHRPYNLGWGHHHCNVVAKDSGIIPTVQWMHETVARNVASGWTPIGLEQLFP